eukprot:TRINITY_DN17115_c0_g1_i1.p2 TRINITY_DN17115_c0_g1~~TRINITY_DN17115_c0_g1_i1.p2  ORF type:complete len:100 (+),score=0.48 TRINITY_DN17115_c0_g1_i1:128-427(+)
MAHLEDVVTAKYIWMVVTRVHVSLLFRTGSIKKAKRTQPKRFNPQLMDRMVMVADMDVDTAAGSVQDLTSHSSQHSCYCLFSSSNLQHFNHSLILGICS